jgi:hypothetical protein
LLRLTKMAAQGFARITLLLSMTGPPAIARRQAAF